MLYNKIAQNWKDLDPQKITFMVREVTLIACSDINSLVMKKLAAVVANIGLKSIDSCWPTFVVDLIRLIGVKEMVDQFSKHSIIGSSLSCSSSYQLVDLSSFSPSLNTAQFMINIIAVIPEEFRKLMIPNP